MRDDTIPVPGAPDRAVAYGDLTDDLLRTDWWTDEMVAARRHPRRRHPVRVRSAAASAPSSPSTTCGSAACPTSAIRVLTQLDTPWESYEYLTRVSQIPRGERLRSRLGVLPGQHLGLPELRRCARRWRDAVGSKPLWHVLVEPIFADYWTPKAGQAFESMEQESDRIRYPDMRRSRARSGWCAGASAAATSRSSPRPTGATPHQARRRSAAAYVHVAVGYPGLKFLPDLHGLPRDLPRLQQRRQRLRAARARLRAAAAARRAPWSSAAAASSPRACCSG